MNASMHNEYRDLFSAYVDHDLPQPYEVRLREHLGGCAECRLDLSRFERAVELVRQAPRPRAPEGFARRVTVRARARRRRLWGGQGGAALVASLPAAEVVLPVLLAAAVAALVLLAAH